MANEEFVWGIEHMKRGVFFWFSRTVVSCSSRWEIHCWGGIWSGAVHVLYHDLVANYGARCYSLAPPRYQYLRLSRTRGFIWREASRRLYSYISIFHRIWRLLENWLGVPSWESLYKQEWGWRGYKSDAEQCEVTDINKWHHLLLLKKSTTIGYKFSIARLQYTEINSTSSFLLQFGLGSILVGIYELFLTQLLSGWDGILASGVMA